MIKKFGSFLNEGMSMKNFISYKDLNLDIVYDKSLYKDVESASCIVDWSGELVYKKQGKKDTIIGDLDIVVNSATLYFSLEKKDGGYFTFDQDIPRNKFNVVKHDMLIPCYVSGIEYNMNTGEIKIEFGKD